MHASRRCTCARSRTLRAVALACRQVFVGICSSAVLITAVAPLPAATRLKDDLSRERIVRLYSPSRWTDFLQVRLVIVPLREEEQRRVDLQIKSVAGSHARDQLKIRIYFQYTSVDF